MNYAHSYFKALSEILSFIGAVALVISCAAGSLLATYLVLASILAAVAGPIAIKLQKDVK